MAPRPTWQGHLKLSLVTCPVALYSATSPAGDVHFHMINPKTNNRIKMITTDPETGPVDRADLVKGYEVEKGRYVILTNEEIKSVRLESTKTIDIESFVPASDIDRLYWDNPYVLVPDGKMAVEAFSVIRDAMAKSGQIALGRIVMSTRERVLALEPRDKGILAYTIRSADEVRDVNALFDEIPEKKPDRDMIAIAEKIIAQKEEPFEPAKFVDRYEKALRDLIASKQKGKKAVSVAEPEDTTSVTDLMAALKQSLDGKAAPARKRTTTTSATTRRPRATAKKASRRRAAS